MRNFLKNVVATFVLSVRHAASHSGVGLSESSCYPHVSRREADGFRETYRLPLTPLYSYYTGYPRRCYLPKGFLADSSEKAL